MYLARRWKRQPQGPVEIDRNGPLGRRASGVFTPRSAYTGGGVIVPTPIGLGAEDAADAQVFILPRDVAFQSADAVSVFVYGWLGTSSGSASPTFSTRGTASGSGNRRGFELGVRAGSLFNGFVQFIDSSGNRDGGQEITDSSSVGAEWNNKPAMLVYDISRDTLSRATMRAKRPDMGSEFVSATGTSTTIYGNDTANANAPRIGGQFAGLTASADFGVALALWQIGPSTAEQRAAFYDNPYQILRPRTLRIYSLPASGIPVLSGSTVIDIGQTSARPRVTITF
jgi:hypothetical protein